MNAIVGVIMSGPEFRALRRALGMTQTEIGRHMGCTRQHIGVVEAETTVPPAFALAIRHLEILARQHEAA